MSHKRRSEEDDDALLHDSSAIQPSETPPGVSFVWTKKQLEWWTAVRSGQYRFMATGGAIRGGKTFTVLGTVFLLMLLYPRSRWAIVRMDLPTLRRTTVPSINKMRDTVGSFLSPLNMTAWEYTAANGSKLIIFPESIEEDPELERFNGLEVNGFILEEANELSVRTKNKCVQRAGAWVIPPDESQSIAIAKAVRDGMEQHEAIRKYGPKQPLPFIFLTFNPADNWVREEIYEPYEAGTLAPPWYYLPATIEDNPYITEEFKRNLETELKVKDPEAYERFVKGKWGVIRAPNQLITSDLIKQARVVAPVPGTRREGMDVARYGKDATVHAAVDGNCLVEIEENYHQGLDVSSTRLLTRVQERQVAPEHITVDVVGLGAGVADNMRGNGYRVNEFVAGARPIRRIIGVRQQGGVLLKQRSFYKFADLWSQAWWELKERLEAGEISFRAQHAHIVKDLTAPRYTITNRVIKVESSEDIKERIGRSPDVGVAIVLAFFKFPVRDQSRRVPVSISRRRLA
jgi:hypothetical protein